LPCADDRYREIIIVPEFPNLAGATAEGADDRYREIIIVHHSTSPIPSVNMPYNKIGEPTKC